MTPLITIKVTIASRALSIDNSETNAIDLSFRVEPTGGDKSGTKKTQQLQKGGSDDN
jgi:hypothetical protein